jgi:hypothetical protein
MMIALARPSIAPSKPFPINATEPASTPAVKVAVPSKQSHNSEIEESVRARRAARCHSGDPLATLAVPWIVIAEDERSTAGAVGWASIRRKHALLVMLLQSPSPPKLTNSGCNSSSYTASPIALG